MTSRTATAIASGILIFLSVASAPAQEVSHLGLSTNRLVHLVWAADAGSTCVPSVFGELSFFRRKATGGLDDEVFVIPAGKQLVITDVKWRARRDRTDGNANFTDGLPIFAVLNSYLPNGTFQGRIFDSTPVLPQGEVAGAEFGGSDQIFSGIRVAPGRQLCIRGEIPLSAGFGVFQLRHAEVFGYMVNTG